MLLVRDFLFTTWGNKSLWSPPPSKRLHYIRSVWIVAIPKFLDIFFECFLFKLWAHELDFIRWHVYYGKQKNSLPHRKSIVKALATRLSKMISNAPNSQSKSWTVCSHFKLWRPFYHKSESTHDIVRLLCLHGFSCDCGSNHEMAIKGNSTAIVQTMRYFNREIGLPDLCIVSFRVAFNLHLTSTISYGKHTAVCDRSFSQPLALPQSSIWRNVLKTE